MGTKVFHHIDEAGTRSLVQQLHRRQARSRRKRVRFEIAPLTIGTVPSSTAMSQNEKSILWWRAEDYKTFNDCAFSIGREVRRLKYASCLDLALDYAVSTKNQGRELVVLPGLEQWCTFGHSRRGLEKWASLSYAVSRSLQKSAAIAEVLGEQARQRSQGDNLQPELIRNKYQKVSRIASRFAHMMAAADEAAVLNSYK